MTNENEQKFIITDEIRDQVLKEYFKLRSRKAKHGDINTVDKRGRKRIPDDQREAHKKEYYETVTKPRQLEKRRLAREEAIKNGTYGTKKLGRPKKE